MDATRMKKYALKYLDGFYSEILGRDTGIVLTMLLQLKEANYGYVEKSYQWLLQEIKKLKNTEEFGPREIFEKLDKLGQMKAAYYDPRKKGHIKKLQKYGFVIPLPLQQKKVILMFNEELMDWVKNNLTLKPSSKPFTTESDIQEPFKTMSYIKFLQDKNIVGGIDSIGYLTVLKKGVGIGSKDIQPFSIRIKKLSNENWKNRPGFKITAEIGYFEKIENEEKKEEIKDALRLLFTTWITYLVLAQYNKEKKIGSINWKEIKKIINSEETNYIEDEETNGILKYIILKNGTNDILQHIISKMKITIEIKEEDENIKFKISAEIPPYGVGGV